MAKQKTEKQIRAKEIADKLLAIQMEEHETPEYDKYSDGTRRTKKYSICNINGVKWIKIGDIRYDMNNYLRKMKADGLIADYQVLHVRTLKKLTGKGGGRSRWQINTLVNLSALLACKDELLGTRYLFHPTWHHEIEASVVLDDAVRAEVTTENDVTVGQKEENERMYAERCRLITESNREQRQQEQREAIPDAIGKAQDEQSAGDDTQQPNGDDTEQPAGDGDDFDYVHFAATVINIVEDNRRLRDEVAKLKEINELSEKVIAEHERSESLYEQVIQHLKDDNLKLRLQVEALQQAIKEKEDA